MSFAQRNLVATLALTATFAANANAAEIKELDAIDLTRPIPQGTCVADSGGVSAFDKMETIKKSRGQVNVIEANDIHAKGKSNSIYSGIYFTSNLKKTEIRGFLGEGYVIISDAPKGQKGSLYCIETANDATAIANAISGTKVPATVNKGEMGVGLNNLLERAGKKVGYVAITSVRTLLAVNFNFNTKKGGYILADGGGNSIFFLPLVDVEYSMDLPPAYQKALGMTDAQTPPAPSPSAPR